MEADGSFTGIVTAAPAVSVVWTEYDELKIRVADAGLLAAAPELLDACRAAEEILDGALRTPRRADALVRLRAAIAKAEGQ